MTNKYNGPEVWESLLKVVRETAYPKAVVAGGAVRDWFHDQSIIPRDIDIFVGVRDELEFDIAYHGLPWSDKKQLVGDTFNTYTRADTQEFASNILGGVIEAYTDSDTSYKVNLVGKRAAAIDDPANVLLSDFDHTLCEFWWDGEKVCRSQDAYAAFTTKRIEIKPHAVGKERTVQRLKSLTRRSAYVDYQFKGKVAKAAKESFNEYQKEFLAALEQPARQAAFNAQIAPAPEWNVAMRRWENI